MTAMTERSLADSKTWTIKQTINQSGLDFLLSESPFSLSVKIRKRFLQDRSQQISPYSFLESNHATFPPTDPQESKNDGMELEINRLKNIIEEKDDKLKVMTETKDNDSKSLHSLQLDLSAEIDANVFSQKQLKNPH